MLLPALFVVFIVLCLAVLSSAFAALNSDQHHHALQRSEMVGLWRLTTSTSPSTGDAVVAALPKLEGTSLVPLWLADDDILLMLKKDGSFVQYGSADPDADTAEVIEDREEARRLRRRRFHSRSDPNDDELPHILQGVWEFVEEENNLILALDRAEPSSLDEPQVITHDTIFVGGVLATQINEAPADDALPTVLIDEDNEEYEENNDSSKLVKREDVFLSIQEGQICIGRYLYPKDHPCFFERPNAPIFNPQRIGAFELRQIMGVLNAFNTDNKDEEATIEPKFCAADFHGKKFLLTSEPIQMKRAKPKLKWSRKAGTYVEEKDRDRAAKIDQLPFDLRVMPVEFHRNNTFTATGAGKILRGRFGLEGPAQDRLWFAVSLFGAGRSAPGSVYSEGPGLSHEDKRAYHGDIQLWERGKVNEHDDDEDDEDESKIESCRGTGIFVEGAITVGDDMGTDARAIPVARFTMREVFDEGSSLENSNDIGIVGDGEDQDSIFE